MMVRDRPNLTRQALESLYAGRLDNIYITILDDRSQPETTKILEEWAGEHDRRVRLVRNNKAMGTGPLRNLLVKAAEKHNSRCDLLYFSDNDVVFSRGWYRTMVACFEVAEKEGFKVLGGYNHPFHQPVSRIETGGFSIVNQVWALAPQSMLMRWDTWDKYGPFCETPVDKVCQSEDVDFCNKIQKDGFKIGVVSPHLLYGTGITNTFGEKIPGWEIVRDQIPSGVIFE